MAKLLTAAEIARQMKKSPDWKRQGLKITRRYEFSGFIPAMAFVNHVADLAERMDHHPDIVVKYKKVTLTLSTHSAGGLTGLDFQLARQIDA